MDFFSELQKIDFCWKKSSLLLCASAFLAHLYGVIQLDFSIFTKYSLIISGFIVVGAFLDCNGLQPYSKNIAITPSAEIANNYSPLMLGGAIFLICDRLNCNMIDVIKYAILPAIIIYFNRPKQLKINQELRSAFYLNLLNVAIVICSSVILADLTKYIIDEITLVYGTKSTIIFIILSLGFYITMVFYGTIIDELNPINYHYFLPIILLIWLLAVQNIPPIFACMWSIAMSSVVTITSKAIQSSFAQRKKLKKPKIATELLDGIKTLQNCAIIAAARIVFFIYHGLLIWLIFEVMKASNAWLAMDWAMQPDGLKILICFAPLLFLPAQTPFFWRYFLAINLYDLLAINSNLPAIQLHLLVFYATISVSALQQYIHDKLWLEQYYLMLVLPMLLYINNDLMFVGGASFSHIFIIMANIVISTMILLACLRGTWLVRNEKIESFALGFAAVILLVPDLFMNYVSNYAFDYLPIKLKMAAKYVVYFPILCMVLIVYFRQLARCKHNAEQNH